jgi:hypothetical protein
VQFVVKNVQGVVVKKELAQQLAAYAKVAVKLNK